jgi:hypothetical protein
MLGTFHPSPTPDILPFIRLSLQPVVCAVRAARAMRERLLRMSRTEADSDSGGLGEPGPGPGPGLRRAGLGRGEAMGALTLGGDGVQLADGRQPGMASSWLMAVSQGWRPVA